MSTQQNIPKHVAVIMDGNGRWAKKRGASRIFGHQNAIKAVRDAAEYCAENGVGYLTLYAFSTENWSRPQDEVEGLMSLLVKTIHSELPTLQKNNIKLLSIGDIEKLPEQAQERLQDAKEQTEKNEGLKLVLALNYSGRWELTNAVKRILEKAKTDQAVSEDFDSSTIENELETKGIPDPELLIRTSGEMRISNFLLWQLAYTELYFTEVLWPDFRKKDMQLAFQAYSKRERRFGKTSEQLISK